MLIIDIHIYQRHYLISLVAILQGDYVAVEAGKPFELLYQTNETLAFCLVKGPTPKVNVRKQMLANIPAVSGLTNLFR